MSMVKINIVTNSDPEVHLKNIPEGTYFTGKIGTYSDKLFLKIGDRIISLESPSEGHSWTGSNCPVKNYRPVDVEITVK